MKREGGVEDGERGRREERDGSSIESEERIRDGIIRRGELNGTLGAIGEGQSNHSDGLIFFF